MITEIILTGIILILTYSTYWNWKESKFNKSCADEAESRLAQERTNHKKAIKALSKDCENDLWEIEVTPEGYFIRVFKNGNPYENYMLMNGEESLQTIKSELFKI